MLLFSDLHLREETEEIVLGTVLPGMRKECQTLGETHVVCLGDVFHIRYRVSARLLNGLRDEFQQWVQQGIILDILPGNHDQYEVDGRNVLEYLGDISTQIRVHNVVEYEDGAIWIPYRKEGIPEKLLEVLNRAKEFRGLIFAHVPWRGAVLNATQVDTDGIDPNVLPAGTVVFTGHYHMHQQIPGTNIWYVGSPYQIDAGEAGQPKGFVQWNQREVIRHERKWAPRYHVIHVNKGESIDFSQIASGDDVRVQTAPGVNIESVSQALRTVGVRHTITPDVEPAEVRLAVGPTATLTEYAQAYVNLKCGEDELDPQYLMKIFAELTQ